MNNNESNRRKFIRSLALSTAAVAAGTRALGNESNSARFAIQPRSRFTANDNINIALIGSGGMGVQDTITALQVPGVKLIAVCDL